MPNDDTAGMSPEQYEQYLTDLANQEPTNEPDIIIEAPVDTATGTGRVVFNQSETVKDTKNDGIIEAQHKPVENIVEVPGVGTLTAQHRPVDIPEYQPLSTYQPIPSPVATATSRVIVPDREVVGEHITTQPSASNVAIKPVSDTQKTLDIILGTQKKEEVKPYNEIEWKKEAKQGLADKELFENQQRVLHGENWKERLKEQYGDSIKPESIKGKDVDYLLKNHYINEAGIATEKGRAAGLPEVASSIVRTEPYETIGGRAWGTLVPEAQKTVRPAGTNLSEVTQLFSNRLGYEAFMYRAGFDYESSFQEWLKANPWITLRDFLTITGSEFRDKVERDKLMEKIGQLQKDAPSRTMIEIMKRQEELQQYIIQNSRMGKDEHGKDAIFFIYKGKEYGIAENWVTTNPNEPYRYLVEGKWDTELPRTLNVGDRTDNTVLSAVKQLVDSKGFALQDKGIGEIPESKAIKAETELDDISAILDNINNIATGAITAITQPKIVYADSPILPKTAILTVDDMGQPAITWTTPKTAFEKEKTYGISRNWVTTDPSKPYRYYDGVWKAEITECTDMPCLITNNEQTNAKRWVDMHGFSIADSQVTPRTENPVVVDPKIIESANNAIKNVLKNDFNDALTQRAEGEKNQLKAEFDKDPINASIIAGVSDKTILQVISEGALESYRNLQDFMKDNKWVGGDKYMSIEDFNKLPPIQQDFVRTMGYDNLANYIKAQSDVLKPYTWLDSKGNEIINWVEALRSDNPVMVGAVYSLLPPEEIKKIHEGTIISAGNIADQFNVLTKEWNNAIGSNDLSKYHEAQNKFIEVISQNSKVLADRIADPLYSYQFRVKNEVPTWLQAPTAPSWIADNIKENKIEVDRLATVDRSQPIARALDDLRTSFVTAIKSAIMAAPDLSPVATYQFINPDIKKELDKAISIEVSYNYNLSEGQKDKLRTEYIIKDLEALRSTYNEKYADNPTILKQLNTTVDSRILSFREPNVGIHEANIKLWETVDGLTQKAREIDNDQLRFLGAVGAAAGTLLALPALLPVSALDILNHASQSVFGRTTEREEQEELSSSEAYSMGAGMFSFFLGLPEEVRKDPWFGTPYAITMIAGHNIAKGAIKAGETLTFWARPDVQTPSLTSIELTIGSSYFKKGGASPYTAIKLMDIAQKEQIGLDLNNSMTSGKTIIRSTPDGNIKYKITPFQAVYPNVTHHAMDYNWGEQASQQRSNLQSGKPINSGIADPIPYLKSTKDGIRVESDADYPVGGLFTSPQTAYIFGTKSIINIIFDPREKKGNVTDLPKEVENKQYWNQQEAAYKEMEKHGDPNKIYPSAKYYLDTDGLKKAENELYHMNGAEYMAIPKNQIPKWAHYDPKTGTAMTYDVAPFDNATTGVKAGDLIPVYWYASKEALANGYRMPSLWTMYKSKLIALGELPERIAHSRFRRPATSEETLTSPDIMTTSQKAFKTMESVPSVFDDYIDKNGVTHVRDPREHISKNELIKGKGKAIGWDGSGVDVILSDNKNTSLYLIHSVQDNAPKNVYSFVGGSVDLADPRLGGYGNSNGLGFKQSASGQLRHEVNVDIDPSTLEQLGIYMGRRKDFSPPGARVFYKDVGDIRLDPKGRPDPSLKYEPPEVDVVYKWDFTKDKAYFMPPQYYQVLGWAEKHPQFKQDIYKNAKMFKGDKVYNVDELLDGIDNTFHKRVRDGTMLTEAQITEYALQRQAYRKALEGVPLPNSAVNIGLKMVAPTAKFLAEEKGSISIPFEKEPLIKSEAKVSEVKPERLIELESKITDPRVRLSPSEAKELAKLRTEYDKNIKQEKEIKQPEISSNLRDDVLIFKGFRKYEVNSSNFSAEGTITRNGTQIIKLTKEQKRAFDAIDNLPRKERIRAREKFIIDVLESNGFKTIADALRAEIASLEQSIKDIKRGRELSELTTEEKLAVKAKEIDLGRAKDELYWENQKSKPIEEVKPETLKTDTQKVTEQFINDVKSGNFKYTPEQLAAIVDSNGIRLVPADITIGQIALVLQRVIDGENVVFPNGSINFNAIKGESKYWNTIQKAVAIEDAINKALQTVKGRSGEILKPIAAKVSEIAGQAKTSIEIASELTREKGKETIDITSQLLTEGNINKAIVNVLYSIIGGEKTELLKAKADSILRRMAESKAADVITWSIPEEKILKSIISDEKYGVLKEQANSILNQSKVKIVESADIINAEIHRLPYRIKGEYGKTSEYIVNDWILKKEGEIIPDNSLLLIVPTEKGFDTYYSSPRSNKFINDIKESWVENKIEGSDEIVVSEDTMHYYDKSSGKYYSSTSPNWDLGIILKNKAEAIKGTKEIISAEEVLNESWGEVTPRKYIEQIGIDNAKRDLGGNEVSKILNDNIQPVERPARVIFEQMQFIDKRLSAKDTDGKYIVPDEKAGILYDIYSALKDEYFEKVKVRESVLSEELQTLKDIKRNLEFSEEKVKKYTKAEQGTRTESIRVVDYWINKLEAELKRSNEKFAELEKYEGNREGRTRKDVGYRARPSDRTERTIPRYSIVNPKYERAVSVIASDYRSTYNRDNAEPPYTDRRPTKANESGVYEPRPYESIVREPTTREPTPYEPPYSRPTPYSTVPYNPVTYRPQIPVPPRKPPREKQIIQQLDERQEKTSINWKQGFIYKRRFYPWRQEDIINTTEPIPGVKYLTGFRSAYETVFSQYPKEVPSNLRFDMGIMDTTFKAENGKVAIEFREDSVQAKHEQRLNKAERKAKMENEQFEAEKEARPIVPQQVIEQPLPDYQPIRTIQTSQVVQQRQPVVMQTTQKRATIDKNKMATKSKGWNVKDYLGEFGNGEIGGGWTK